MKNQILFTIISLASPAARALDGWDPATLKVEAFEETCERVVVNIRRDGETISTRAFTPASARVPVRKPKKARDAWPMLTGQALDRGDTPFSPDSPCPRQIEVFGQAEEYTQRQSDKLALAKNKNRFVELKPNGELALTDAAPPAPAPASEAPAKPADLNTTSGSGLSPADEQALEAYESMREFLSPPKNSAPT